MYYFKENGITWWSGELTNHTLSSQVACLNHLFPLREDKNAVLSIVKRIYPEIADVLILKTDRHRPAYIQFEAVSDADHLNEGASARGGNRTSMDALIYGSAQDGRKILFLIGWKYIEAYDDVNKASGDAGKIRTGRYAGLIRKSEQLRSANPAVYYFEPFYQLMRRTLWAEQMVKNKSAETIQADDYIFIHVIPPGNGELVHKLYPCSGKEMEDTWRSLIKDQKKYKIVSPKDLLKPIAGMRHFQALTDYLMTRYW
ncbi:MAG TPA: hypothetical protein VN512_05815 [Clostridia bacterium]|nr:hypothetical protein [Clostridia bacterium]